MKLNEALKKLKDLEINDFISGKTGEVHLEDAEVLIYDIFETTELDLDVDEILKKLEELEIDDFLSGKTGKVHLEDVEVLIYDIFEKVKK